MVIHYVVLTRLIHNTKNFEFASEFPLREVNVACPTHPSFFVAIFAPHKAQAKKTKQSHWTLYPEHSGELLLKTLAARPD